MPATEAQHLGVGLKKKRKKARKDGIQVERLVDHKSHCESEVGWKVRNVTEVANLLLKSGITV